MSTPPNPVPVGPMRIGRGERLALIAGPCVMEPGDLTGRIADRLAALGEELGIPVVFKASFDKANRSSPGSPRGPGADEGLRKLERVRAGMERRGESQGDAARETETAAVAG